MLLPRNFLYLSNSRRIESSCFPNWSIFNHIICHQKQAQNNSNLSAALSQAEAGAGTFFGSSAQCSAHFIHPAEYKSKPHSDEVQMSAVKRGQLRVLCGAVGADQQPASLSASQTLSDQAVQSAQLTGNRGSLIEFLLLTALFFFFFSPSLLHEAGFCQVHFFPPASCQKTDCTELHTQALAAPPTVSVPNTHLSSNVQHTMSGRRCFI